MLVYYSKSNSKYPINAINYDKCFENIFKEDCFNCSTCNKNVYYYWQGYKQTTFNKIIKNGKSRFVFSDCKIDFESGISTNKQNTTKVS